MVLHRWKQPKPDPRQILNAVPVIQNYRKVIEAVSERIASHLMGNGRSIELDTSYKVIGGGKSWSMIRGIAGSKLSPAEM